MFIRSDKISKKNKISHISINQISKRSLQSNNNTKYNYHKIAFLNYSLKLRSDLKKTLLNFFNGMLLNLFII